MIFQFFVDQEEIDLFC